ncbi:hypothetical protein [Glaciecola petra]|uniref:DUF4402 domain-containing protein n=1 Tax=Glaciecola petra TaxID=3075602 RepID=A0ABU2ZMK4_9ALTE|nr:hypothetical protein [Aestuariibacter sp. P117]MDT0593848.1 hypothetical protein [Aestuariibacter sp. P117]
MQFKYLTYCSCLLAAIISKSVIADSTLVRTIDFGTIVVLDNSSVQSIEMDRFGAFTFSSGIRPIAIGEAGLIEITDYAPGTTFIVSASITQSGTSSPLISLEHFELYAIDVPSSLVVPGTGIAELRFGGSIRTSGSGSEAFTDTTFTSRVRFTLNF